VKQTIKEALAKGADRGIHIVDDNFFSSIRSALKGTFGRCEKRKCDLILTVCRATTRVLAGQVC